MVKCWVHSCKHYNVRETCRFFSFPLEDKKRERWLELLRYDKEPGPGARICSCHFEGGVKENGPSIFTHNNETFIPHHLSPEAGMSRMADIAMEDIPSTSSTDEPLPIELIELDTPAESDILFKSECEESDLLEHSENADVTMQAHENDKLNATSNIYIKREMEEDEINTDVEPTENVINVKNEYIDSDDMDDNVLTRDGTSKVNEIVLKNEIDEFQACDTDNIKTEFSNEIRDNRINYEVKIDDEIVAGDATNKFLSCGSCMVTYQDYCTKCDMLVSILNGTTSSNKESTAIEDIPKDILEIRKSLASFGMFALKVIPEGVRFGPFFGSNISESSWRIKGGKFLVGEDKSKFLNWMQYINPARNSLERNLAIFRHESNLYYRTIREIQEGEELLVYFGEQYEDSLINDVEVDFVPTIETDIEDAFVCTFCCLGFSSMIYLVNHKTICPYRITGGDALKNEIVQCPQCKLYLEQGEYNDYHIACCGDKSARQFVPFSPNHQMIISSESKREQRVHYKHDSDRKAEFRNHTNNDYQELNCFKCTVCDYATFSKSILKRHMDTTHQIVKRFKCTKCYYVTNDKINLAKHISTHETATQFKCSKCDYTTNLRSSFNLHFGIHEPEKRFKCSKCDYATNFNNNLKMHLETHEPADRFKCAECDYATNVIGHFKRHFKTHEIVKRHKCSKCSYATNVKIFLENHLDTHDVKKQFKCAKCDYATNYKSCLKEHSVIHGSVKRFKCSKCDYAAATVRNLNMHLERHEVVKQLKCSKCDYATSVKSHFKRHLLSHEPEGRFKCSKCDYATSFEDHLKMYASKHEAVKRFKCTHCDYATNCFKCTVCDYATFSKSILKRHVDATHQIVKRFKCTKCYYITNDKSNLAKHISTHETAKQFKCSKCDYATNLRSSFNLHFGTHGPEKRFKCSNCDYATSFKKRLKMHASKHETVKRFKCTHCHYSTNYKGNLKTHVGRHEAMK